MSFLRIFALLSTFAVVYGLRCYQTNGVTMPLDLYTQSNIQLTECPMYSLTCIKNSDNIARTVYKACANTNCSTPYMTNAPATCINNTATQFSCCCYGDGCNAAPMTSLFLVGATVFSLVFF